MFRDVDVDMFACVTCLCCETIVQSAAFVVWQSVCLAGAASVHFAVRHASIQDAVLWSPWESQLQED